MAFIPKKLTRTVTFIRHGTDGLANSDRLTLHVGEPYLLEIRETENHFVYTAKVTRNGNTWFNVVTDPKDKTPVKVNQDGTLAETPNGTQQVTTHSQQNQDVPIPLHIKNGNGSTSALQATARDATAAVARIAAREGYSLKTGEAKELQARRLARIAQVLQGEVYQLNYYIPSSLAKAVGQRHIKVFHRHAYRLDGSNWVITAKGLESKAVKEVFAEWDRMQPVTSETTLPGVVLKKRLRYWKVQYTKEQLSEMRAAVIDQLQETLIECHTSLIERMEAADKAAKEALEKLDNASSTATNQIQRDKLTRLKVTANDACERFGMCVRGAEIFDDSGDLNDLFEAIRVAILTQVTFINLSLAAQGMSKVKVPDDMK